MNRQVWKAIVLFFVCVGWAGCLEEGTSITVSQAKTVAPTLEPTSTPGPPPLSPIAAPTSLANAPAAWPVPPTEEPYYEDRTGPVRLLASYYNAVDRQEYARAWAYWQSPPSPTYEDFVNGFADTESVLLVVRPPTRFEGAAGSTYAALPVWLSAAHTDGSRHNFVGCFVARRPNVGRPGVDQQWSLYDAAVRHSPGKCIDVTVLEQICARGE